ncbi:hypothetical protein L211DRAFT_870848 [Terfezia boudieri ATCC MYA-4762]|uniref:Uncharacterized protein n=1 Tax=Terfezia boudieri ATCC MYA-4762 TaxID=1051890 RepID=A0A3N4LBN7_9PEZI|nr:hypothetical protein L211DRAFT_870848 [Terfezia boudieri ATCC MYA-4762]
MDEVGSTYGLDCNLSSDGHTGVGTLEFELHDDDLIDEEFFDEYAPQENEGDGDYVLDDELEVQGSLDFVGHGLCCETGVIFKSLVICPNNNTNMHLHPHTRLNFSCVRQTQGTEYSTGGQAEAFGPLSH